MRRPGRGAAAAGGIAAWALSAATRAWEHRLLDRALRGRLWIALVTCALLGIVTLQLALLALNGTIGRSLERKAQLVRENTALSIESSALASDEHVRVGAAQAGMIPIALSDIHFLDARHVGFSRALAALREPTSSAPVSESQASQTRFSETQAPRGDGESPAPFAAVEAPAQSAGGESTARSASGEASAPRPSAEAGAGAAGATQSTPATSVSTPAGGTAEGGVSAGAAGGG